MSDATAAARRCVTGNANNHDGDERRSAKNAPRTSAAKVARNKAATTRTAAVVTMTSVAATQRQRVVPTRRWAGVTAVATTVAARYTAAAAGTPSAAMIAGCGGDAARSTHRQDAGDDSVLVRRLTKWGLLSRLSHEMHKSLTKREILRFVALRSRIGTVNFGHKVFYFRDPYGIPAERYRNERLFNAGIPLLTPLLRSGSAESF